MEQYKDDDAMTDADWEKVFHNPALLAVLDYCPPNTAEYHDEEEDERILENLRRNAPSMNQFMQRVIEEMEHGA